MDAKNEARPVRLEWAGLKAGATVRGASDGRDLHQPMALLLACCGDSKYQTHTVIIAVGYSTMPNRSVFALY